MWNLIFAAAGILVSAILISSAPEFTPVLCGLLSVISPTGCSMILMDGFLAVIINDGVPKTEGDPFQGDKQCGNTQNLTLLVLIVLEILITHYAIILRHLTFNLSQVWTKQGQ